MEIESHEALQTHDESTCVFKMHLNYNIMKAFLILLLVFLIGLIAMDKKCKVIMETVHIPIRLFMPIFRIPM